MAAIWFTEWGGGGGGAESAIFIWPLFWWAKTGNSSVASFLVGGGEAPKYTGEKRKKIMYITYMHDKAKRASASET